MRLAELDAKVEVLEIVEKADASYAKMRMTWGRHDQPWDVYVTSGDSMSFPMPDLRNYIKARLGRVRTYRSTRDV